MTLFSSFQIVVTILHVGYSGLWTLCWYLQTWYYQSYDDCFRMISREHAMGFTEAAINTLWMLRVLLCKAKIINHNFYDLLPSLQLACSSAFVNKLAYLCCNGSNFCVVIQTILASSTIIFSIHWEQVQSLQQLHIPLHCCCVFFISLASHIFSFH